MNTEWFVITNATHARVFSRARNDGRLRLVTSFEHLASRKKSSELGDDKAGRELSDRRFGGAALSARTDLHRKEHERFAHELGQFLEHRAVAGAFDAITLFAAPPFLGELKQELGRATGQRLAASRPVDLSAVGPAELEPRIREALDQ